MTQKEIHIAAGKDLLYIPLEEIILIKAAGNYCDIHLANNHYDSIRIQIGQLWDLIEKEGRGVQHHLERVGRSYIINLDLLIHVDPRKGTITLHKPGSPGMAALAKEQNKRDLPEELLKHVQAIEKQQKESETVQNSSKDDITIMIGKAPTKELLVYLKKEKRKEVLQFLACKKQLSVPVEKLNDDHVFERGQEYVDLGLTSGTLWATRNVSAKKPEFTEYYSWAQLYISDSYDDDGYKNPSSGMPDSDQLPMSFDVARQDWGGNWRLPTAEEFQELERECILTWCQTADFVHGVLVTGPNGNRIFLPATGYMDGVHVVREREADYWTSTNTKLSQMATAATLIDLDDDNAEATLTIQTMKICKGLSIRPVLSRPTTPEAPKVKTLVVVNDINMQLGEEGFRTSPLLEGWRIVEMNIPVSPQDAMNAIKKVCDEYSPEVIVGKGTGSFYVHQFKGYKRICANPLLHPSEIFTVGIHECIGLTGDSKFKITEEIHQQFKLMEKHQFDNIDNHCWGLLWDADNEDAEEFCEHYSKYDEIPVLKRKDEWESTVLVPLIKQIA